MSCEKKEKDEDSQRRARASKRERAEDVPKSSKQSREFDLRIPKEWRCARRSSAWLWIGEFEESWATCTRFRPGGSSRRRVRSCRVRGEKISESFVSIWWRPRLTIRSDEKLRVLDQCFRRRTEERSAMVSERFDEFAARKRTTHLVETEVAREMRILVHHDVSSVVGSVTLLVL